MKLLSTCLLTLALSIPLISPPSHAVVGLIVRSHTTRAIGGITAAGGLTFTFLAGKIFSDGWVALGYAITGLGVAALGIVVLEDGQEAEFQFMPVEGSLAKFTKTDIATYNQELEELNAINQTVAAQLQANPKLNEMKLWQDYGEALSPATVKIAAYNGKQLLESLR